MWFKRLYLYLLYSWKFSHNAAMRLNMRLRFGRLARFALTPGALGEHLSLCSWIFLLLRSCNLSYVQGGLQAAESSSEMGTGGRVPSGYRLLRRPLVCWSVLLLRRRVRVLHESGLGSRFQSRMVDDLRCPLLRLSHRSQPGGCSRSSRTLVVGMGASAFPSTSGNHLLSSVLTLSLMKGSFCLA